MDMTTDTLTRLTTAEGEPLFTTAEAAEALGLSRKSVQSAIQRGRLAAVVVSTRGERRVTGDAIEAYRRTYLGKRGGYRPRRRTQEEERV